MRIRNMRPELTAEQAAEFRGFFFGEGHMDLTKPSNGRSLCVRLRIAVRDDDAATVHWCRSLFGGNITRRTATRSLCWELKGRDAVGAALDVLAAGELPSKKRAEVALMAEAVSLIGPPTVRIAAATARRLAEIRDELKALRQYRAVVDADS